MGASQYQRCPLVDPRDVVGCSCPRIDGGDCADTRYGIEGQVEDPCSCACHDLHEEQLRESEEDQS
jgi:hypothetical protein